MKKLLTPIALAAGLLCTSAAHAELELHGYFRTQAGTTSAGGNLQCFNPGWPASGAGDRAVGRLGNECDNYGELNAALGFGDPNDVWGKYHLSMSYKPDQASSYEPVNGATPATELANRENYFEAGGFFPKGSFENSTLWVGKRYYNRDDIHILDQYYLDNTGTGAGVQGIDLGMAKASVAYLQSGKQGNADGLTATKRYALKVYDIAANKDGKLESELTLIRGSSANNTPVGSGYTLSIQHNQSGLMGGFNKLALVVGKDTGAGFLWTPVYSGNGVGDKGNSSWRVHEQFFFDLKGTKWSGMVAASAGQIKTSSGKPSFQNIVFRPQYSVNKNFSVAFELGHAQGKDGASRPKMTKFTIAPQLALSPGFWARPVLRVFATHAKWNADAGTQANGAFGNKTSGTTVGFQAEAWW